MADQAKAHITVEACDFIIGKLENYAEKLVASDKKMNAALDTLSETHRDQNFELFDNNFTPLWDDIKKFKEAVDLFRDHMIVLKRQAQEYEEIAGKLRL